MSVVHFVRAAIAVAVVLTACSEGESPPHESTAQHGISVAIGECNASLSALGMCDIRAIEADAADLGSLVVTTTLAQVTSNVPFLVSVEARDTDNNLLTSFSGPITVSIGANPGGILVGTLTVNAVNGVASFTDLTIGFAVNGYTLLFSASGVPDVQSNVFAVVAGPASQLSFLTPPTGEVAGVSIAPSIRVVAQDAFGNNSNSFAGSVTISKATGPGVLSGTTTRAASSGVATFNDLSFDLAGGYTLSATSSGLTGVTSSSFTIFAAAAASLVVTTQPSNSSAGLPITPAVRVAAIDAFGNAVTTFGAQVQTAIGNNPGGATLSGSTTVTAMSGVATFSDLTINNAADFYTLTFSSAGLVGATSLAFDVIPPSATELVFTVQPSDASSGSAIAPAVQVTARDGAGNIATSFNGSVSIAKASGPGLLSGTTSVSAIAGVATFTDLSLNLAGAHTLSASAAGLTGATSASFTISAGTATQLVFTVQPSDATAGIAIAPAVEVTARDASGNVAMSFSGSVTIAIGADPGGATLDGTTTISAIAGVATFADLSLDAAGEGYTLVATASGLAQATSTELTVAAAAPARLVFGVQPTSAVSNVMIAPAPAVEVRDAFDNLATQFTGTVTIAIGNNPGSGALAGTLAVPAVDGVAVFSTLSIDRSGTGYTLAASATGLTGATSVGFDVLPGNGSQLTLTVQPSDAVAGAAISPAIVVAARDMSGNLVTSFTGNVTLLLTDNPSGATLSGSTTVAAVGGIAAFADVSLDRSGTGYRISATSSSFAPAASSTFDISPAAASRLAVLQQPSDTVAGVAIAPAVQIVAQDAFGNQVPSFTGDITVALGENPGGATLAGTTMVAASAGIASFTTLSLDHTGTGYTLEATSTGLATTETEPFDVTSAMGATLELVQQPSSTTAGTAIAPAITVRAVDALGNTDIGFTGPITIAISNNAGGATLAGTTSRTAVAGIATFDDLALDKAGSGYTLAATGTGLSPATSIAFDITAGPAVTYVAAGLPANVLASSPSTVTLTAHDAYGNVAASYAGTATLSSSDAAIEAPTSVTFTSGVAASAEVTFRTAGAQTLTATDSVASTITATFDTNVSAADPPTVVVTSPADGDTVRGEVVIEAMGTVAASTTLARIEVLVDGEVIGEATTSPASVAWDTTDLPAGSSHEVVARITDAAGTVALSEAVTVTVAESSDGCGCASSSGGPSSFAFAFVLACLLFRRPRLKVAR